MTVETSEDGPVWIITNNRPEVRNAVDPEPADALFGDDHFRTAQLLAKPRHRRFAGPPVTRSL